MTLSGTVAIDVLRRLGLQSLDATWELIVQEGKVRTFGFAFTPASAARLQEAQRQAQAMATGLLLLTAPAGRWSGLRRRRRR